MYRTPPKGFRGFVWEPSTEQEVVVLFGLLLPKIPMPLAIGQAWTPFPDCSGVLTRDAAMDVVHIEFEYRSSSFWPHRAEWKQLRAQDPSAKWWVVCWHDDLGSDRLKQLPGVEVLPLRETLLNEGSANAEAVVLNWYDGDPADPILPADVESKFSWRAQGLTQNRQEIVDALRQYGGTDYVVEWLPRPDIPAFTVRIGGVESFKVFANGTIAFPCHRWPLPLNRRTAVLNKLADTFENDWFKGRETKKKSCAVLRILRGRSDVEPLVEALRALAP